MPLDCPECGHGVHAKHRTFQERLENARSNLRFAERRIATLEAELLERDAAVQ
ncbi:hypothetical protein GCM10009760_55820 [Kitasatospora kazusensis]|uniref:Uncharacterized protein n=1 Tax=Kitasatospora kazusensis TaxID=407974 RepID=A0ABP5LX41_9ACTN